MVGRSPPRTIYSWHNYPEEECCRKRATARLVGAGGPEVAVLHSPALCALHCTPRERFLRLARSVGSSDRSSELRVSSYFFATLSRSSWVGEEEEGVKRVKTSLVPQNPDVLRPGLVGMRGQCSYDYGMQDYEYTPPPQYAHTLFSPFLFVFFVNY